MAIGLAEAGADVIAISRPQDQVDAAAERFETLGRKILRVTANVFDRSSLEHFMRKLEPLSGKSIA